MKRRAKPVALGEEAKQCLELLAALIAKYGKDYDDEFKWRIAAARSVLLRGVVR